MHIEGEEVFKPLFGRPPKTLTAISIGEEEARVLEGAQALDERRCCCAKSKKRRQKASFSPISSHFSILNYF